MKLLLVIPANRVEGKVKISTFLQTEITGLSNEYRDLEIFHFFLRRSICGVVKAKKALKQKINSFKPDFIHVHYGSTTSFLVSQVAGNIPWIITFGGSDLLGHPNKGLYWRMRESFAIGLSKYSIKSASAIICVSKNLADAVPAKLKNKVHLIPRGVNTSFFFPKEKVKARQELNWDLNKKYILFSLPRSNADVKNLPLAVKSFEMFREINKEDSEFVILHEKNPEYIRLAMNAADVLIVTSLHEGSPNIVKESMACNLPIVAVNCGDVKTRLDGVKYSYVSREYDAKEISQLLNCAIQSGERTDGRRKLEIDGITINQVIQRLIDVYKEVKNLS